MTELIFNEITIGTQNEMLSLTDMWRAADAPKSREPYNWARKEGKAFIEAVALTLNLTVGQVFRTERGRYGATWAHWQIGLAYAKYLSPPFHMFCNTTVRDHMEGRLVAAEPEAPSAAARPSGELTMRQRRQYLAEVTQCRMTQGIGAARLLWDRLGFMAFPAELLDPLEPRLQPRLPADLPADDWRDMLAHLMIHHLEDPTVGGKHPVPVWIAAAAGLRPEPDLSAAHAVLRRWGLRVDGRGEAALLIVANQHPMLARLFRGTPWKDGEWKRALRFMPGATATTGCVNFAGVKARGYAMPLTAIPGFGEDEEDGL